MVTCCLDVLKNSLKRKDMTIKRKTLRCYNKLYTVERRQTGKTKILALTLYLLDRITLNLISSPAIIGCF